MFYADLIQANLDDVVRVLLLLTHSGNPFSCHAYRNGKQLPATPLRDNWPIGPQHEIRARDDA